MSDNNSDNMIRAVDPGDDSVIKGSNFPTPMGMAPAAPTDSAPQSTETTSTGQGEAAPPAPEQPQASSGGSDAQE